PHGPGIGGGDLGDAGGQGVGGVDVAGEGQLPLMADRAGGLLQQGRAEGAVAAVAQVVREVHHRGLGAAGGVGDLVDGQPGGRGRVGQDHVGDAGLDRSEVIAPPADHLQDGAHRVGSGSIAATAARIIVRPVPWARSIRRWSGPASGTPRWTTTVSGRARSTSCRRRPSWRSLRGSRVRAMTCGAAWIWAGYWGVSARSPRSSRAATSCWGRAPEACSAPARTSTTVT